MRYTTPPAAQDPVRIVFDFQAVNDWVNLGYLDKLRAKP